MSVDELKLMIEGVKLGFWILGGCMGVISAVFSYYARMIHSDVRKNTGEVGKNKGRCEQLQIQIKNEKELREKDLEHQNKELENQNKMTQRSIQNLADNVSRLSGQLEKVLVFQVKGGKDGNIQQEN